MRNQIIAMAAAAAFGIGMMNCNFTQAGNPADASGNSASAGLNNVGANNGASTTAMPAMGNPGPIGAEFAMDGSDQDMQAAIQSANNCDKLFLVNATIDNECQLQFAQIAVLKTQDPQVKQIAERIVQDHQQEDTQLQATALQVQVQLPRGIPAVAQQELKVMQSLGEKDFDLHYISRLRATDAKAISECTDTAQLTKNGQVKDYANKTLPILRERYQQTQQAAVALGLPGPADAQTAGARMQPESDSSNQNNSSGGANAGGTNR